MKMGKKLIGVLLSICLILGALSGNIISGNLEKVSAAEGITGPYTTGTYKELTYKKYSTNIEIIECYSEGTYKELTYHKYTDHIEIADCNPAVTSIAIPDKIDGLPVTVIGSYAFNDCSNLVNITIPNSVTSIEKYAFFKCKSLTEITIPNSVTSIGEGAFRNCTGLRSITLPDGITSIAPDTFWCCESLTGITLPDSVTSIGENTFYLCESLTGITIPNSVTSIGESAFENCTGLRSITLPDGITSIAPDTFYYCESLTGITLPDSVTSIGEGAFGGCYNLKKITIPPSVTNIDSLAFLGCDNLVIKCEAGSATDKYAIANGLKQECYTNGSFNELTYKKYSDHIEISGCNHAAVSIVIPESIAGLPVTAIDDSAFYDCGKLTAIRIPNSVTRIGVCVFDKCSKELVIQCEPGSYAEKYAKERGYTTKCPHKYATKVVPATLDKDGSIVTKCSACEAVKEAKTIYAATTVKLSETLYTYNGKTQRPNVVVKDRTGNEISASNYTVTHPRNSKNVNKYTVTVKFKRNYSGTKKLTYKILPKRTGISKLSARKKGFTVKLKKRTKQVTGYQVQYATNKRFQGAKTVTIKKYKTTSKTISGLKAGKKYYVRARTYKKVKISGKYKRIYAGWSKVKAVRTRK